MSSKLKDWVWLIGGSVIQMPMVAAIKARGLQVMVSDGNPNCRAAGLRQVDRFEPISTYDIEGHLRLARQLERPPRAVLTVGADVGPTVSALAAYFGLPGVARSVAEQVRHTGLMRAKLKLPHPAWLLMEVDDDPAVWERFCRRNQVKPWPCVVKALNNCGSRGLSLVTSADELPAALRKAQAANREGAQGALVEEQLFGPEVALDFLVEEGEPVFANGAFRFFHRRDLDGRPLFGIEAGHVNPWQPPEEVLALCRLAAERLEVDQGPFKVDLIRDPRFGWCILECATRLSGGFDHSHTAALGPMRDVTGAMLAWALGEGVKREMLRPRRDWYAAAYAPRLRPGRIVTVRSPIRGVFGRMILTGDKVRPLSDCSARNIFFFGTGATGFLALFEAVRLSRLVEFVYEGEEGELE